jgi:hypothetical protein
MRRPRPRSRWPAWLRTSTGRPSPIWWRCTLMLLWSICAATTRAGARLPRVALAGLPPPLKPWPQSWRRATSRAGGVALGDLPQLPVRSRSERTETQVSAPRPGAPRPGRPPARRHQLPRRPRGLTPSGFCRVARRARTRGTQIPAPAFPLSHFHQHGLLSRQQEIEPSRWSRCDSVSRGPASLDKVRMPPRLGIAQHL